MPTKRERYYAAQRQFVHKPAAQFKSATNERVTANTLYMGIELELECQRGSDLPIDIIDVIKADDPDNVWYFHGDGSLQNGVECVTHPMTFNYIKKKLNRGIFPGLKQTAAPYRYSDKLDTSGVHIHLSRNSFTDDAHRMRFKEFHLANAALCKRIAGRDVPRMATFARHHDNGRYQAVNTHPHETIELRYFRATTNEGRFLGYAEWARAIFMYTRSASRELTEEGLIAYMRRFKRQYENALAIYDDAESHAAEPFEGYAAIIGGRGW